MRKFLCLLFALSIYCSPAVAQQAPAGLLQALLGSTGPVQGLTQSLQRGNLQPLVDGVVGKTGLIQGRIASPLNRALSGLLVEADFSQTINSAGATVAEVTQALGEGLLDQQDLQRIVGADGLLDLSYGSGQFINLGLGNGGLALPGLTDGAGLSALQLDQLGGLLSK